MQTATPTIDVAEDQDMMMTPTNVGIMDATDGLACDPEEYYNSRRQITEYCEGYISINPSVAAWLILAHYALPVAA